MRKCFSCSVTKNLKSVFIEDCDCHFDSFDQPLHHSTCRGCYSDLCPCEDGYHFVVDCLEDETCVNHKQSKEYDTNWNDYDYNWKLKKNISSMGDKS